MNSSSRNSLTSYKNSSPAATTTNNSSGRIGIIATSSPRQNSFPSSPSNQSNQNQQPPQQHAQQRVWVRQCAIDSVLQSSSTKGNSKRGVAGGGFTSTKPSSSHSNNTLTESSKSFNTPTPPLRGGPSSTKQPSWQQQQLHSVIKPKGSSSSLLHQQLSQSFSSSSTTVPADLTDFSSSSSDDISANAAAILAAHHTYNAHSNSSASQRVMEWGWKECLLLEQGTEFLTIQLLLSEEDSVETTSTTTHATSARSIPTLRSTKAPATATTTVSTTTTTIQLPLCALEQGTVVLANDDDPVTLQPAAPADLIALTHLHEPAVCVALRHRYDQDVIYTNTGPVLLALNPFAIIPGLYGEAVQKKYVEAAESLQLAESLPPHVYAIADAAFRSMMRSIEDSFTTTTTSSSTSAATTSTSSALEKTSRLSVVDATTTTTTPSTSANNANANANSNIRHCINQSILVSGESGSGKTVTTKFVMKYLAALSQRSVQLQESSQERAYVKASGASSGGGAVPEAKNWRTSKQSSSSNSNSIAVNSTATNAATSNSSIEAQVLQSNPILESFGNARTVRNDNSSRFGKFIEIQFTATGKLVGAQLQTYLLEKVRLVRQSAGERNYHIFYEFLSGGMNARELSHYFLAPTAGPEDFKLLNGQGTVTTRRDGIGDRETYADLIAALTTMKFTKADIQDVFCVAAAILHASNLTFTDLHNETCCLDESNVHLDPVCTLLGLSVASVNQALCHCMLTAGGTTVTRSLTVEQAVNGLEALLKETYGAMFQYLVQRINGQISAGSSTTSNGNTSKNGATTEQPTNCSSSTKGVATIGVLDIFGFESFAVNSFEQLCINYCNEALQQQFNAFVLENEQAEYEREGITWSFIEFPENQDVLDLIERRGASILSILDDQCRAPGPSDKAFCLAVYSQCGSLPRFETNRKQQAMLQFSIHHYAGPVEYTATGFTAKNKDELPKETILLLSGSEMPLVRELASIMEGGSGLTSTAESADPNTSMSEQQQPPLVSPMPRKQLHRADSSVGRPTVGGQFRSQLRALRLKIDHTAPHYIRCLKPNDLLVPDHFDTAIVAEQLKCGGILEAVRVARAGFTQHYTHADFCRRYRTLAWKEMATASLSSSSSHVKSSSTQNNSPQWASPSFKKASSSSSNRHSYPLPSYVPRTSAPSTRSKPLSSPAARPEIEPAEAKVLCKDLIKVLYRKIQQQGVDMNTLTSGGTGGSGHAGGVGAFDTPSPVAKAKTYSFNSTSSSVPSWSKGANSRAASATPTPTPSMSNSRSSLPHTTTAATKSTSATTSTTPQSPKWKRAGSMAALTGADLARVGIQMGKTKVFLRHKAFEALERIRSLEQTKAATKLNSIFRRYLARIAFIPYRDAFRLAAAQRRQRQLLASKNGNKDEFKETKEQDFDDTSFSTAGDHGVNRSFQSARSSFHNGGASYSYMSGSDCLYDKWTEIQIKEAIHNPVPRNEWGKQIAPDMDKFKWVIRDGLWVKNYSSDERDESGSPVDPSASFSESSL